MYFMINVYKIYMWWFDMVNINFWVDILEDYY